MIVFVDDKQVDVSVDSHSKLYEIAFDLEVMGWSVDSVIPCIFANGRRIADTTKVNPVLTYTFGNGEILKCNRI